MLPSTERHLAAVDPVLAALIEQHGPCTLEARARDPFHVLCSAIISQQLSSKAADTIQARVLAAVKAEDVLRPEPLLAIPVEVLRACGLSQAKARWLQSLATAVRSGAFSFEQLAMMDDETAIAALDALPGIGRWTAEMFLIFALHRLDIFAMDDVGLRRGLERLYNRGRPLSERRIQHITRRWRPYRSVASWYLWRAVDADTQTWV